VRVWARKEWLISLVPSTSHANRHALLTRNRPLALVIPTGAPRGLVAARNPRARSGGTPRKCPPSRSFREFFPKCQSQLPVAERIYRGGRHLTCFMHGLTYLRTTGMPGPIHGENSLRQYGHGETLGISPLRAKGVCRVPGASWRSGRDDRMRHCLWARARLEGTGFV
jgi:hypothetical protein